MDKAEWLCQLCENYEKRGTMNFDKAEWLCQLCENYEKRGTMNFDKATIMKILVGLLVLAFLLQIFGFNSPYAPPSNPSPTASVVPSLDLSAEAPVQGNAEANAQVASYPDGILIITGQNVADNAELRARLEAGIANGSVAYTNSASPDVVNVIMTRGADLGNLTRQLLAEFPFYAYTAKTVVTLPANATFVTERGNITARLGGRMQIAMEPLLDAGDNVSLGITATVDGGIARDVVGSAAQQDGRIAASGQVTEISPEFNLAVQYEWEERNNYNESYISARIAPKYPNASVAYEPDPSVVFRNASDAQRFAAANLSYVIFASENYVVVAGDFTNRSLLEDDLRRTVGDVEFALPLSTASINATGEYDDSFFRQVLPANFRASRNGRISLPSTFEWQGVRYYYGGAASVQRPVPVDSVAGTNATLIVRIMTRGPRIISLS